MMPKKNSQEILGQASDSCYHYALRKLNVGVASVLIGTTMYVGLAHADTVGTSNEPAPIAQAMTPTTVQSVSNNVVTSSDTGQSQLNHSSVNKVSSGVQSSSNQQASNAVQNDSSSIYDQEQQTSSFDVRNAGVNNAALYNDNKVSQQNQLGIKSGEVPGQNVHMSMPGVDSAPHQGVYHANISLTFDITSKQFQDGKGVYLGSISSTTVSDKGYKLAIPLDGSITHDVIQDGINWGQLFWKSVYEDPVVDNKMTAYRLLFLPAPNVKAVVGTKHFSISMPSEINLNYGTNPKAFDSTGKLSTDVVFTTAQNTTELLHHFSFLAPGPWPLATFKSSDLDVNGSRSLTFNSDLGRGDIVEWIPFNDVSEYNDWINSGYNVSTLHVRPVIRNAMRLSANQTFYPCLGNYTGIFTINVFNDKGQQTQEFLETDYADWSPFQTKDMGNNLSLADLVKLNFNGMSLSRQSDGSVLVYTNVDSQKIINGIHWNNLKSFLNNSSYVINTYSQDSEKALNYTLDAIKHGLFAFTNGVYVQPADSTVPLELTLQRLDLNTGNVIYTSPVAKSVPASLFTKGQSAVKLHVINSKNGVDLYKVQSFVGWPDQNKHAALTIPSVAGYHLVANPQSVLSILHLSGTAISASTQASYPAENTIADYYVVMAPDTETVKVDVVDTDMSSTLSSYTLSGLYGSTIQSTSALSTDLQALLASGKYDLVSNPLTSLPKYSTTNNPITISLKHHIDSTQRHYRVIEDLPDGTKKVIIDMEATLYKDANAKYYNEWGANLNGIGKILKSNEYRILAGQQVSSLSNNSDVVSAVDMIPGYVATFVDSRSMYRDGVYAVLTNNGKARVDVFNGSGALNDPASGSCAINPLSSRDFHITYSRRSYPVTVNYYDLLGALISSSKSQHLFADSVDVAPSIPSNYVLAPGQSTHLAVSCNSSDNQLDLVVIPRVIIFTDSRTITRTIQITRPDRSIGTIVQHVTFSRPAYKDAVSGVITYGLWTTPSRNFIVYQPGTIDGYHIDIVKSQVVLPTDKDSIVQVTYTKLVTSLIYPYIDDAGHSYNALPVGYHVVTGQNTKSQLASALIAKDTGIKPADDVQYVTRTVTITLLNGRKRVIHQRVRQGTRFGKVAIPKLHGYKVVISGDSQKLGPTSADRDMNMSVKFIKM